MIRPTLITFSLLSLLACAYGVPDQEFYDLVSFLEESREALISQNVPVPLLTAILSDAREKMTQDGLKVNDAIFDRLKREFEAYEAVDRMQLQPPEPK